MSGHAILIRIDRDCMHRKFVGRAEDADGNFLKMNEMEWYVGEPKRRVHVLSYPAVCDEDLCQGPAVARRLAAHGLDRVHGRAWNTRGSGKNGCESGGMKGRHDGGPMKSRHRGDTRPFIIGQGRRLYAFEKEKLRQGMTSPDLVGNSNVLRKETVGEAQAQMGRQLVIIIIGAGFGSLIY